MSSQYSFLTESLSKKIGKWLAPNGAGQLVTYAAAGGLLGTSMGGTIGLLYGAKVFMDRKKTIQSMEKRILNPDISAYNRQQLIDEKNMIMSMTDQEYRNYALKEYYEKGTMIGSTVGTAIGSFLSRRK